jgi:uncharacterized membrane protein YqjE
MNDSDRVNREEQEEKPKSSILGPLIIVIITFGLMALLLLVTPN